MILLATHSDPQVMQNAVKDIDYTPDVTSDAYWDAHNIAIVRISEISNDDQGRSLITYTVRRSISDGGKPGTETVRSSHLWFGMDEEPPRLAVNQELILYKSKQGQEPVVASLVHETNRRQIAALLQIARLRTEAGPTQAILESAMDQDEVVSRYSLRRLLSNPPSQPPQGYVARLVQLRDQQSRPAVSRILSEELAEQLEGREKSDGEYSWLQDAIRQTPAADWTDIKPFVDRIVEFEGKRRDNVVFLTGLVKQQNAQRQRRIAAYSSFDDPRMFHAGAPDQLSDVIFDTCIQMLKDPDPVIRGAGAALLHKGAARIASPHRSTYVERAKQAIQSASEHEEDAGVRGQFTHYLSLLRQIPAA